MTLVLLGIAWIAGFLAVQGFHAPWWMGCAWVLATVPAVVATTRCRKALLLAACCVFVAGFGGWRAEAASERVEPSWLFVLGNRVIVEGTVGSEPDRGAVTTGYVLNDVTVRAGGEEREGGKVLVYLHQYSEYSPGDRLVLEGELETPPTFDGFDYRAWLASKGISATMYRPAVRQFERGAWSVSRALTDFRLTLDESLKRALPEPEASLASGIAFGRDDGLPREAKDSFNRSGLRHLVAVSGSNVSLVVALTYALAVPVVGRRRAWLPAGLMLVSYLGAAGFSPSVVRSGLMAATLLAGGLVGRPQSGLPALAAAVIGMTLHSPRLASDPGFLLSASATAGLIAFGPWSTQMALRGSARWGALSPPRWLCEAFALTVVASVATAPVMWATFGEVSLVSPLANVIAQPAFAAAFWSSLATSVLGLVSEDAGRLAGVVAYYPLRFLLSTARTLGGWEGASFSTPWGGLETAAAAYAALGAAALVCYRYLPSVPVERRETEARRHRTTRVVLAGATGACALAIVPISLLPRGGPGQLVVDFLDVGQGDSALITTPHGHQVLIDGGPSGVLLVQQLGEVMPHWDRSLDAVILTHPQEDHVAGLPEALARFDVAVTYGNGHSNPTTSVLTFERRSSEPTVLNSGGTFEVDGVEFEILWPPPGFVTESLNDTSIVLRVSYRETTFLFTGDSEEPALAAIRDDESLAADVLKVPHHGSKTTPAWFFEAVHPAVAVISVGADNPYGHPHPATIDALSEVQTYQTAISGRVTVRSDGHHVSVSTER